jgi:enolase
MYGEEGGITGPNVGEHTLTAVTGRRILDSHLGWTFEFEVVLDDTLAGRGSAPRGETPSVYEQPVTRMFEGLLDASRSQLLGRSFTQESFDEAAATLGERWGTGAVLAVSIAYHDAASQEAREIAPQAIPRLMLNLLNGGLHAYTNPVASDFTEVLLLPRDDALEPVIEAYLRLLEIIPHELRKGEEVLVGDNRVFRLGQDPNHGVLEFVQSLLERERLAEMFGIVVDASAGDWVDGDGYRLPVTGRSMTREQAVRWWLSLVADHELAMVEDPLAEHDTPGWDELHALRPPTCAILGDNYTSTSPDRLASDGRAGHLDGVLVKPNQNGTVSGSLAFAAAARARGLLTIASHRSIETESTFLIDFALRSGSDAIKIGPFRDFSAVVKFNELLRRLPDPP